jgi:hypothetical protein
MEFKSLERTIQVHTNIDAKMKVDYNGMHIKLYCKYTFGHPVKVMY